MNRATLIAFFCATVLCPLAYSSDPTSRPYKQPPFLGMTQAQVFARYGEPYHRVVTEKGPQWYYRLKFGEVYGREFVPFQYDSDNVYLGVITFDPAGSVRRIVWNHSVSQ